MATSKKPRKKRSATMTAERLKSIAVVQEKFKELVFGACQIAEQANYTFFRGKTYDKPTFWISDALLDIKFDWCVILGVLSRLPNGDHSITFKRMYSDKPYKLYDLDKDVLSELRKMFDEENHDYRLTTFWLASPNQEADFVHHACALLQKWRVPDNMITQYELREKGEENVPSSYCNTTYWWGNIEWYEIVLEEQDE